MKLAVPRPPAASPFTRLAAWPQVQAQLETRGLRGDCRENPVLEENLVGTRLMALYRDTRDADCFEALYAFTGPNVLHWIKSLLTRELAHLDAREILQDTFVNVYRYPSGFREDHPGSFRVWVRTIAGNVVRRSSGSRPRMAVQELSPEIPEPAERTISPPTVVEHDEEACRLRGAWRIFLAHYARAYRDLSQRDRRTLHLVEVEGRSYVEAGRILGVGRSNLKMMVFRSRKRLARRMRQAMGAPLDRPRSELGAA